VTAVLFMKNRAAYLAYETELTVAYGSESSARRRAQMKWMECVLIMVKYRCPIFYVVVPIFCWDWSINDYRVDGRAVLSFNIFMRLSHDV